MSQSTTMPITTPITTAPPTRAVQWRRRAVAALATPGLLRLILGGTWALAAVFLLAAGVGIGRHRHALQAIGKDSAPSIIAAQQIRTSLAWAHADAARALAGDPSASAAYDGHRRAAGNQMVSAAENITFGDAERGPIHRLVDGLGRYAAAVAVARAGPPSPAALAEADRVLHGDLLPDADSLDTANRDALNRAYADERSSARWGTAWAAGAGVLLAGALVGGQAFLARRTRRLVNPGLAVATALVIGMSAWLVVALFAAAEDLRATKADAFDSVSALMRARAVAVDGYATRLAGVAVTNGATARDPLAAPPPGMALEAVVSAVDGGAVPDGFTGFLADELRNITYVGEHQSAADTLRTYVAYLRAPPAEAGSAFARFDAALGGTLDINRVQFDAAVGRGFDDLRGLLAWSAGTAIAVVAAAHIGLRPRLREYAA